MATTALYVEILVIGALAELWIIVIVSAFINTLTLRDLAGVATAISPLTTLLLLPALALTYALGWIINFASERLFKPFFQKRIRDRRFPAKGSYQKAKVLVLHSGSADLVHDVLFDRHIIRIARANVFNFALISVGLLLHLSSSNSRIVFMFAILFMLMAVVSFAQWRSRYESHYQRICDIAAILAADQP